MIDCAAAVDEKPNEFRKLDGTPEGSYTVRLMHVIRTDQEK